MSLYSHIIHIFTLGLLSVFYDKTIHAISFCILTKLAFVFHCLSLGSLHFPLRWYIKGRAGVVRPKANNRYRYRYYDNNVIDRRRNYNRGEIYVNNQEGFKREEDRSDNDKAVVNHGGSLQNNRVRFNEDQQLDNAIRNDGMPHLPRFHEVEQKVK